MRADQRERIAAAGAGKSLPRMEPSERNQRGRADDGEMVGTKRRASSKVPQRPWHLTWVREAARWEMADCRLGRERSRP